MQFRLRGLIDVIAVCHSKELLKNSEGGFGMQWWLWVLIAIGLIALGAVKLAFFNMIRKKGSEKRRFTDED